MFKSIKKFTVGALILGTVFTTSITTATQSEASGFSGKASISLNIRSGPGVNHHSIGAVSQGTVVSGPVVNGWVQVNHKGRKGYVSKYYLSGNSKSVSNNNSYNSKSDNYEKPAKKSQAPSGRTMTMEATAYTATGNLTASGTRARVGAVAVDPNVIPLGTRLYIEGYGYATAEDTGGAIKGNIIDLYMNSNSEVYNWGRRPVKVTILD